MTKEKATFINEKVLQMLKYKEASSEERFKALLILLEDQKITEILWKQLQKMGWKKVEKMPKDELMTLIKESRGKIPAAKNYPWDK